MPDSVGVRCIVILLYQPFKLIPSSQLLALARGWDVAPEAEIYGEMCQDELEGEGLAVHDRPFADRPFVEQTLKSYQEAQKELESQLQDAIKRGDKKHQFEIKQELGEILKEIRPLLWKGKAVHFSMREERDRKCVWSAKERAIRDITNENVLLGQHLKISIRTGEFCSYTPDRPITWER